MPYILALDQGTTSSRAIVFDHDAAIVAVAQQEFRQIFPKPGWVEHDPQEIWATQIGVAVEALGRAGLEAARHRRHRHHQPARDDGRLGPRDRRADLQRDRLAGPAHGGVLRPPEGRTVTRTSSASAPAWSSTRISRAPRSAGSSTTCRARARRPNAGELAFGTIDTWLVWKLTGGATHVTDVTNASRTMLFNIHTLQWDDDLLTLLRRAARACCPRSAVVERGLRQRLDDARRRRTCRSPGSPATSRRRSSARCACRQASRRTPTAPAASCCRTPARRRSSRATGCSRPSRGRSAGRRTTRSKAASSSAARWCSGCATGSGIIRSRPTSRRSRHPSTDSGGVYLVPAFAGLGAPHWDPYARGTIVGTHARHDRRPHRARRAREHRLPGRRPAARRCATTPAIELRGAARRRRRGGERPADAVPGRSARRAGRPAEGDRDDGARRGVSGRARGRLLGVGGRAREALAGGPPVRTVSGRPRTSRRAAPNGTRRSAERRAGARRGQTECAGPTWSRRLESPTTAPGTSSSSAAARPASASPSTPPSRGYDVLLLEQHDFGKGTSSRSTKLVHGGVRYLEQGNISLVMEALKERGLLRQNAPHLVSNLAFVVPNYDWWEAPFYGLGLKVYNLLAGKYGFGALRDPLARGDARAAADDQDRRPARRRRLLRRAVRRRAAAHQPGGDGGRAGRDAAQLRARRRA